MTPFGRLGQVVDSGSVTSFANLTTALPDLVAAICAPRINVEKTTNGAQADTPPGPTIPAGDAVNWEYTVSNTGQLTLRNVTVTDDNNDGATIVCPGGNGTFSLDPGQSVVCTASSVSWYAVDHKQHANTATAVGTPLDKPVVTDTDDSHYKPTLVCPFGAHDGIVVDIFGDDPSGNGGFMLGAPGLSPNQVGPIAVSIPAGSYNVSWASYDAHSVKGETNPGQTSEVWYLDFGGTTSAVTGDIPWNADLAQGTLGSVLTLGTDQTSVIVRHGGPANTTNSVHAVCVVLDPIDPADISVTKTLITQGDLYEGDLATFDVTIENGSDDEWLTVTSLTENIGGGDIDLLEVPDAAGLAMNTCNNNLPLHVEPNGSVTCTFAIVVSASMTSASDDRCDADAKIDVVAVVGVGKLTGTRSSDDDCADLTVNPEPVIAVDKSVVTTGDIDDGDTVTFEVIISNLSDTESVTIDTLTENIGGADIDLLAIPTAAGLASNTCNADPTIVIPAGGDFTCEFSIVVTADMTSATDASCPTPGTKVDVVTASGSGDSSGRDVTADDCAEITVRPEPGGELTIDKLVYDPTTGDYVDQVFLPSSTTFPTIITWQITVGNPTQWVVETVYLTDPNAAACETELVAALDAIAPGKTSLDPLESVTFTCDSSIAGVPAANTATAGGTDAWGRPVPEVSDSASVFQVLASGIIGDTVWYDTNGNGVLDGAEVGIANVTVTIVGNNGQDVDPVTPGVQTTMTTVTNASGMYLFSGLPAGSYTVSVALSSVPNASTTPLRFTTPGAYTIGLPEGGSVLTADFGVVTDTLPVTGVNTDSIVLLAIMFLVGGALAVLLTHRKEDG